MTAEPTRASNKQKSKKKNASQKRRGFLPIFDFIIEITALVLAYPERLFFPYVDFAGFLQIRLYLFPLFFRRIMNTISDLRREMKILLTLRRPCDILFSTWTKLTKCARSKKIRDFTVLSGHNYRYKKIYSLGKRKADRW